jgi:hypothetical protein
MKLARLRAHSFTPLLVGIVGLTGWISWSRAGELESRGKTLVSIEYPAVLEVPLPDGGFHELSHDLSDRLNSALTHSEEVIVLENAGPAGGRSERRARHAQSPGFEWSSFPVPAVSLRVGVREISFVTGARGDRTLYGWDERMRDPFLDHPETGIKPGTNEFTARGEVLSAFDGHFSPNDSNPVWGSYSGLDLSEGLSLNALLAYMRIIVRSFRARVILDLEFREEASGQVTAIAVPSQASGFYFEIAGGYLGYSGGVLASRRDAMIRAIGEAVKASGSSIITQLRRTTRAVALDGVLQQDGVRLALLATGAGSHLPAGIRFENRDSSLLVETTDIRSSSGTVARVLTSGSLEPVPGMLLFEQRGNPGVFSARTAEDDEEPLQSEIARTGGLKLPSIDFKKYGISELSDVALFFKSLSDAVFLPYRIYRWWMYDQSYHKKSDSVLSRKKPHASLANWVAAARGSAWGKRVGLDQVPEVPARAVRNPIVAIIDTGVDYNHPVLHAQMALEDAPFTDTFGRTNRLGWDFFSGDSRPFDENDHGTELASLVLAVSPHAKILPLKAFNAWGMTSSQAIYSSVRRAIESRADIILLGWSTERENRVLRLALEAAEEAGVPTVIAAGDRGRNLSHGFARASPALEAKDLELALVVAALDRRGYLLGEGAPDPRRASSNWGVENVDIIAPGEALSVCRPRARAGLGSGTSYSAALVAGALARVASLGTAEFLSAAERKAAAREWKKRLLEDARRESGLLRAISEGRALRVSE